MLEQKLRATIEGQHGGTAHLAYIDVVSKTLQGRPVEGGLVFVFDLEGHPEAARAYGWTSQGGGDDERRFHVVLQVPPIASVQDALRSATSAGSPLSRALLEQLARQSGRSVPKPPSGANHRVSASA